MPAWQTDGNPDADIGANSFLGTRSANDPLRIRTGGNVNNADAMTITPAPNATTTGNVGIGTASPRSRFQLKSLTAIDEGATAAGAWANFGSNSFYDGAWKRIDPTKAGVNFHINPDDGAGQEFRFNRVEADGSNLRNLAVIGSTASFIAQGNVGIGMIPTAASQKLTLGSGNVLLPNANAGTDGNLYFGGRTDTGQLGMRLFGGRVNPGPGEIHAGFIDVRTDTNTDGLRIRVDTGTGGTERMRVTAEGNITWGNNSRLQTDQGGSIELGSDRNTAGTGTPYIDFHFRGLTQDFNTRIINDANDQLTILAGTLRATGNAIKPGGDPWGVGSDIRLKKNVKPLKGALGKLLRLRGIRFEWKEPEKQGNLVGPQLGLVAQEVEEVFPEWVDTDPSGYKILTVRGFEALAIEAFRELKAENETLKLKNEELEDRIKILESTILERQLSGNRNGAVR
jgi:hypothetical protein